MATSEFLKEVAEREKIVHRHFEAAQDAVKNSPTVVQRGGFYTELSESRKETETSFRLDFDVRCRRGGYGDGKIISITVLTNHKMQALTEEDPETHEPEVVSLITDGIFDELHQPPLKK